MAFQGALKVDPPVCPIAADGGVSKHTLTNQSDLRLAFKVRSTNNSNYSVSVVHGFVNAGESLDFKITRVKGKPKADRLVFQFASVAGDASDPQAPFASGKPEGEVAGETIVKLSAAE
ncbi:unnamed protein product [Caenorhabditis auriculariae]|uniref:MSP domain-containing protein n=1 Tax=Caenorhabditis auriculariae TaxID=2777116 RepID=A0A8S1GQW5_9PELO|nr:unnamed protein product [Caenorhabditis auriculariae]